jgi:DNA repair exonuclease SbcCD ATPase subunit
MREIILKKIHMENFKIFFTRTVEFTQLTKIFAQNYRGKSSIVDAFYWCLFGKSSTGNSEGKQFQPRRYDENGNPIDHVDVVVELELEVDGKPITIRKVQKQKWVRKRGAVEETYQGDVNEYYWNEMQVKESEHKARVAEIIDEEVFKMITNPHAFVSKKMDEQRKFLVEKVAQISDQDVFALDGSFNELKGMIEKYTIEELAAINKKALKGYKEQQEQIPVRIDEVSKSIMEIDFSDKELQLSALKEQLSEVERKLSDTSKAYEEVGKLKAEIADYKSKIEAIERTAKEELSKKKQELTSKLDGIVYELLKNAQEKDIKAKDIAALKEKISAWEITFETLKKNYSNEKAKEFDESQNICPVCKQEFPEDKKKEMIAKFEEDKKNKLYEINIDGKNTSDKLKESKQELEELEKQLSTLTAEIEKLAKDEKAVKAEIQTIPAEIDLTTNQEYTDLKNSLSALEFALKETLESLKDTDALKAKLTAEKAEIQGQIEVLQGVLATKQHIEDAKDRVEELKEELKKATSNAAKCEKVLYLIEQFEKAKMNLLSERINQKFKLVKWQLFRPQKNGGIEQVCIPMVHGSPYGENTTSTTERLMAGLDIINTLQEIYEVKAPIWIDNAEAYNYHNIPEMDCQMIQLHVSEDKEIRVVNEK